MNDIQTVASAFDILVRLMLDKPDGISLEVTTRPGGAVFRLSVAPEDLGKIIGKQGRNARSLRIILGTINKTTNNNIALDIVDDRQGSPYVLG